MNVQDAAIQILKDAGKPLHAKEIAERIIQAGLWVAKGKTPEATVSARLYSDIKKHGDHSTFVKVAPQTFSLRDVQLVAVCDVKDPESKNEGSSTSTKATYSFLDAAEKVLEQFGNRNSMHYRDITDKAMNQGWLNTSGKTPEATINAQLLAEMGFESIEMTKYGGDGGIDVRGTLLISYVVRIKMAVQAKRWKGNIQSPTVQQVCGSLGAHEQGLIITTSDFSTGAIKEANQPDKTPVGLMNGEQLVTLLMEYNIGVRRMSHDLFELEELPIEKDVTT